MNDLQVPGRHILQEWHVKVSRFDLEPRAQPRVNIVQMRLPAFPVNNHWAIILPQQESSKPRQLFRVSIRKSPRMNESK